VTLDVLPRDERECAWIVHHFQAVISHMLARNYGRVLHIARFPGKEGNRDAGVFHIQGRRGRHGQGAGKRNTPGRA